MKIVNNAIELRPYSITQLAAIYQVSNYTMRKWLKRHSAAIGEKTTQLYTVQQVKTILQVLDLPGVIQSE